MSPTVPARWAGALEVLWPGEKQRCPVSRFTGPDTQSHRSRVRTGAEAPHTTHPQIRWEAGKGTPKSHREDAEKVAEDTSQAHKEHLTPGACFCHLTSRASPHLASGLSRCRSPTPWGPLQVPLLPQQMPSPLHVLGFSPWCNRGRRLRCQAAGSCITFSSIRVRPLHWPRPGLPQPNHSSANLSPNRLTDPP